MWNSEEPSIADIAMDATRQEFLWPTTASEKNSQCGFLWVSAFQWCCAVGRQMQKYML